MALALMQPDPMQPGRTEPQQIRPAPAPRILLLAGEAACAMVATLLRQRLLAEVQTVSDERRCLDALRGSSYTLLLLEESFAWENEAAVQAMIQAAGSALVLEINSGLSSAERIVAQARAALARRDAEERKFRASAVLSLREELSASLSGLLLESQLALRKAGPEVAPLLRHLVTMAEALSGQLRP